MRTILTIFSVLTGILLSAQRQPVNDYPQVALAKDADGQDIMFDFVATDSIPREIVYQKNSELITIVFTDGFHSYHTQPIELKNKCRFKSNDHFVSVTGEGYLTYSGHFLNGNCRPRFYDFNGNLVWENGNHLISSFPTSDVVICNKSSDKISGYKISTGDELWTNEIRGQVHLISCGAYNDGDMSYLIGDSLYRLNLVTGDIISHPFNAGSSHKKIAAGIELPFNKEIRDEVFQSAALGMKRTGTHSNWIVTGDTLIIADADSLYCFNRDLVPFWRTPLPVNEGSKTSIQLSGNKIRLVCFGLIFARGTACKSGKPYTASFNLSDGRILSSTHPEINKKILGCAYTDGGRVFWMSDKDIFYTDECETTPHKIKWKPRTDQAHVLGRIKDYIIHDSIGIVEDDKLHIIRTDSTQLIIEINNQDVNVVGIDGTCTKILAKDAYFHDHMNIWSNNVEEDEPTNYVSFNPVLGTVSYCFDSDRYKNEKIRSFVMVDSATDNIRYYFRLKGTVMQLDDDLLLATSNQGFWIRKL